MTMKTICDYCDSGTCQMCHSRGCQYHCAQTFCKVGKQLVSSNLGIFQWSNTPKSGNTIKITAADWNKLKTYIQNAHNLGSETSSGVSVTTGTNVSSNDPITADEYNKMAAALGKLAEANNSMTKSQKEDQETNYNISWSEYPTYETRVVAKQTTIAATHFSGIQDYINQEYTLLVKQCDICNTCQKCLTCQDNSKSTHQECCSCDTCQNKTDDK